MKMHDATMQTRATIWGFAVFSWVGGNKPLGGMCRRSRTLAPRITFSKGQRNP